MKDKNIIAEILPISLNDYPSHITSLVYFQGCNLRCGYCFNYDLIDIIESNYKVDKIFEKIKSNKFIDSVTITGGEPLLHFDQLLKFCQKIKKIGLKIKLDTNGSFPYRLKILLKENLIDSVALDIKGNERDYEIFGANEEIFKNIKKTILILKNKEKEKNNFYSYFRTTLIKGFHNLESIKKIISIIPSNKDWFIQSFINEKINDIDFKNYKSFSYNELKTILENIFEQNPGINKLNKIFYDFNPI